MVYSCSVSNNYAVAIKIGTPTAADVDHYQYVKIVSH